MRMVYIIVSTYRQIVELICLTYSLKCQTYANNEVHIYHDGPLHEANTNIVEELSCNGGFWCTEKRYNDFGHSLRQIGLDSLPNNYLERKPDSNDFIIFTNGDNYYTPNLIEEINKVVSYENKENIGVVYWDMVHSHNRIDSSSGSTYGYFNTEFIPCKCDIGAFAVRYDIAKKVGFNHRHNEADAEFIKEILEYQKIHPFLIKKINKVLFVHN